MLDGLLNFVQEAEDTKKRLEEKEKNLLELEEKLNAREEVLSFLFTFWFINV